jgi:hypothetical protein
LYPQYEDFFKQLLGMIFEVHYGFYKELMNNIIWAVDAEIEEGAYRFHKGRLEDRAIPDFYDALDIYRSLEPDEIRSDKSIAAPGDSNTAPSFALAVVPADDLLGRALQQISDSSLIEGLQLELASLANKVVVADQVPADSPEAIRGAVDKTAAYVNLGLHLAGGDSEGNALKALGEVFLEHLFRLAQTRIMRLRNRMLLLYSQGWISKWPHKLSCLDPGWMESAELLLRKTPRLRSHFEAAVADREDYFRTPADLNRGEHFVNVVQSLGEVFRRLSAEPEQLDMALWQEGQIRELADVTIGNMLWTAAAQHLLTGRWEVEPIPKDAWAEAYPSLAPAGIEKSIRAWINQSIPAKDTIRDLESYLAPLFRAYEEEMASFEGENPPEPRLVRFFLFKE